jgi:hypothetical protein
LQTKIQQKKNADRKNIKAYLAAPGLLAPGPVAPMLGCGPDEATDAAGATVGNEAFVDTLLPLKVMGVEKSKNESNIADLEEEEDEEDDDEEEEAAAVGGANMVKKSSSAA